MKQLLAGLLAALFAFAPLAANAQSGGIAGSVTVGSCLTSTAVLSGMSSLNVAVSGTWVGNLQVSGIGADGSTTASLGNTIGSNGSYVYPFGSYSGVKVCAVSWTSGTANVQILASGARPAAVVNGTAYGYLPTYPDQVAASGAISSATTTLVVTGITGQSIYVFFAGVQSTGTNSAATYNYEYGTGATCGTGTQLLIPTALSAGAFAAGTISTFISGSSVNAAAGGITFAEFPFVIPPGNNLCEVSAGTTVAYKAVVYYAQH